MTYRIEEVEKSADEDDEQTWDAVDWCYMVMYSNDDIKCICASKEEAEWITDLLNKNPFPSD